jgi:hypothetical protein
MSCASPIVLGERQGHWLRRITSKRIRRASLRSSHPGSIGGATPRVWEVQIAAGAVNSNRYFINDSPPRRSRPKAIGQFRPESNVKRAEIHKLTTEHQSERIDSPRAE